MPEPGPASARRARSRKRSAALLAARIAVLLASLALVAGIAEFTLRLLGYEPIYEVYSKPSLFWRYDPLLGWHHEPGAVGRYRGPRPWPVEFDNEIRINSQGLRGPEIEPLPEDGLRILFSGDSMVAAFEVAWKHTFVARVGTLASRALGVPVQTLDAGVRGYGTDQSYLWFREHGAALRPDWVVFVHSWNDPRNNMTLHRMRRPFGKGAFRLRDDASLELVGTPVPHYPACSHWALDARFEPRRLDTPLQRAYCGLEMRLVDRSALFTWMTLRLRDHSALLEAIWRFAIPQQAARLAADAQPLLARAGAWVGPAAAHAAPPPVTAASAIAAADAAAAAGSGSGTHEPGGGSAEDEHAGADAPRYRLTSALLRAYARAVRESGARMLILIRASELERMDAGAIRAEGAILRSVTIPPREARGRSITWKRDAHYNELGHRLAARAITRVLLPLIDPSRPPAAAR